MPRCRCDANPSAARSVADPMVPVAQFCLAVCLSKTLRKISRGLANPREPHASGARRAPGMLHPLNIRRMLNERSAQIRNTTAHGARRTNEDKRRAVMTLLTNELVSRDEAGNPRSHRQIAAM